MNKCFFHQCTLYMHVIIGYKYKCKRIWQKFWSKDENKQVFSGSLFKFFLLNSGCIQFRPRKPSDMFYVYIRPHDSECKSTIGKLLFLDPA